MTAFMESELARSWTYASAFFGCSPWARACVAIYSIADLTYGPSVLHVLGDSRLSA